MKLPTLKPAEWSPLDSGLNLLFLAAFPLLLWVFKGSFSGMATGVALIWLLSIALRLISTGQKIHETYDVAVLARRPRVPRKIIGSALIGLMVLLLAGHKFDALLLPLCCGVLATVLSLLAFGPDPLRDKGLDDPELMQRMEVDAALNVTETDLGDIADTVAALDDAELLRRTEAIRLIVLRQLRRVSDRPDAFARIRKVSDKLIGILSSEALRLTQAEGAQEMRFARRRFLAKLELIRENIDARIAPSEARDREDIFDREADRLMHLMPQESAA